MLTCDRCGVEYPPEVLSPMTIMAQQMVVCGICALEVRNVVHGTRDQAFLPGSMAETLRLAAVAHQKTLGGGATVVDIDAWRKRTE